MPLNAVIVDDEPIARQRLRRLLGKVAGSRISVVAECTDVDELLCLARRTRIDVLFLDIELPGGDGFTALQRWNGPPPKVVFVSAHGQHGVRAFEERAVDYVLKPLSTERLRETIARLVPCPLTDVETKSTSGDRVLPLKLGRRIVMVDETDIQVIRAKGNYLDIETKSGTFTFRSSLRELFGGLDGGTFMRVHRSSVVRSEAIIELINLGAGRYRITLDCGREIVTGRRYRGSIQRNLLEKLIA